MNEKPMNENPDEKPTDDVSGPAVPEPVPSEPETLPVLPPEGRQNKSHLT